VGLWRERYELTVLVIWVRTTFDGTMGLQLVDDEGGVDGVDAVGLGEFASAVAGFDEPVHQRPCLTK
jgi:hypothetical protein